MGGVIYPLAGPGQRKEDDVEVSIPAGRTRPAQLVIADDHDLVRIGLRATLSTEPDIEILCEAADGQEVVDFCRFEQPDLVLMDMQMPRMDGLSATRTIKQQYPEVNVLLLSTHEDQHCMLEAIRAGASGYVLKEASHQQLMTAIRKVLEGEIALNRKLATRLLREMAESMHELNKLEERASDPARAKVLPRLTPREIEVLKLLTQGYTNTQIGQALFISLSTVKNHIENVFAKLEVTDRTQAVVQAIELRIIDSSRL